MTTPNPVERLREAAEKAVEWHDGASTRKVADLPAALHDAIVDMREALADLPATPPEQPVSDAERERVPELCYVHGYGFALGNKALNLGGDGPINDDKALLLSTFNAMRSAPAPKPVTTEQAARVERGPSADDQRPKLLRGSASDPGANPGGGAIPSPAEKPAPASDWRERFDATLTDGPLFLVCPQFSESVESAQSRVLRDACLRLRDGLAALEAEVAKLKEKP